MGESAIAAPLERFSGAVSGLGNLVRVRIDIIASEISSVACRIVTRPL